MTVARNLSLLSPNVSTSGTVNNAGLTNSSITINGTAIALGGTVTTGAGTVTSVGGTGTVAGLTLTGTVTSTGNLTLGGTLSTPVNTINDSTTVGQNLVKLTNPTAVTFLRVNADNTVSTLTAATFRTAIGAGTSSTTGTVTSVGGTGTVSGLTLTGTVTTTGNLTLGGTLAVTAANFASQTANTFLCAPNGTAGVPTFRAILAADIPTLNQSTTGTATNATNTAITNDTTTATAQFVTFVAASSGNTGQKVHSTGLTFIASTGSLTASGNITAYSDERLKTDWGVLPKTFVESLAKVKSGTYTRIDSNERQAGSSAQEWQALLPEVVLESQDEKGTLSLAYGNAALVSVVELAKRIVDQEARITELESIIHSMRK